MWWLELVKDNDYVINYDPGKAIVVTVVSRKSLDMWLYLLSLKGFFFFNSQKLGIGMVEVNKKAYIATLSMQPIFIERIKELQSSDEFLKKIVKEISICKRSGLIYNV